MNLSFLVDSLYIIFIFFNSTLFNAQPSHSKPIIFPNKNKETCNPKKDFAVFYLTLLSLVVFQLCLVFVAKDDNQTHI